MRIVACVILDGWVTKLHMRELAVWIILGDWATLYVLAGFNRLLSYPSVMG